MTDPKQPSELEPQPFNPRFDFDIDARDRSRVNAVGELNAETVNFGDRVESQRRVLVVEIDPIPPNRKPEDWINREQLQAELLKRISSDRVPLIEIVAAGGFGKSLLAVWAFEQTKATFDFALWINFRKVPSFRAFGCWVHQEIGFLIDPAVAETITDDNLLRQTIYRLSQRRCLVVMDQLEALETSADRPFFETFLSQWQQQGRQSALLVTTRTPLLANAPSYFPLAGFTPQEGALFLTRKGIASQQARDLEQLSALAEGHPLLLNLAASWLKETAGGQLVETGLSFFERLFQANLGNPEASVGDVFRVLLEQLNPALQTALLEVSVYQDPFDVPKVQAMQPEITEEDIQLLESRGFLLKQQERWTLHPLVRHFVETGLRERKLEAAAHQKAIDYFAAQFQSDIYTVDDYLASFHHHSELGRYRDAFDVMNRCYSWLNLRGYYRILVAVYERLTAFWTEHPSGEQEEQSAFSTSLTRLGSAYRNLGEYRRAIELYEQALRIQQEIGDRNREAANLGNLGSAYPALSRWKIVAQEKP